MVNATVRSQVVNPHLIKVRCKIKKNRKACQVKYIEITSLNKYGLVNRSLQIYHWSLTMNKIYITKNENIRDKVNYGLKILTS